MIGRVARRLQGFQLAVTAIDRDDVAVSQLPSRYPESTQGLGRSGEGCIQDLGRTCRQVRVVRV